MPPPHLNMDLVEGCISKEMKAQMQAAFEKDQRVQAHVEQLAPYDAAMYTLSNGSISQKVSMLQRLHITLRDCDEKKTSELLSELTQAMWTQELELQVAAPEAIITVLPRLSETQVGSVLNGTKSMLNVKNEEARSAWSKLALEMVPYLSHKTVVSEIVPLILKKVTHSEPADQRKLGCKLVGRVCRRLASPHPQNSGSSTSNNNGSSSGPTTPTSPQLSSPSSGSAATTSASGIEAITTTGLLQRALALCQDTERYVRVEMCGQLIDIARAIGAAQAKEKITGELFQLVADEEPVVARAALSAVVLDFVDFYDSAYRKEHVWPVLRSYLQSPQEDFVSLLAEVFGQFLCKVKSDLASSPEDVALLAGFFRLTSQRGEWELRRWCAFNFPAAATVFPPTVFAATLAPVLKALASDKVVAVRRCIAAGLHELLPLLGDRAAAPLKEPVLLLLQDSALEVRHIIFRRLGILLDLFAHQLRGHGEREAFFDAVMPHIVSYEAAVHRDWRLSATLLESFNHFTRYFPGAVLSARLVPPLVHHLLFGAAAVKDLCAPLLIHFTRALAPNNNAIAERFGKFVLDFGRSSNCHHRRTYVLLFCASVGVFSRKFLRVRMMETLLELAGDRVPNVRLQLARAMPIVRRVLKAPPTVDAEMMASFHTAWQKLLRDSDSDVRDAAMAVRNLLEDMERDFSRQAAMRVVGQEDQLDRRREDAETDLSDIAREMERVERRQRLRDMLYKEENGDGSGAGAGGSSNDLGASVGSAGGGGGDRPGGAAAGGGGFGVSTGGGFGVGGGAGGFGVGGGGGFGVSTGGPSPASSYGVGGVSSSSASSGVGSSAADRYGSTTGGGAATSSSGGPGRLGGVVTSSDRSTSSGAVGVSSGYHSGGSRISSNVGASSGVQSSGYGRPTKAVAGSGHSSSPIGAGAGGGAGGRPVGGGVGARTGSMTGAGSTSSTNRTSSTTRNNSNTGAASSSGGSIGSSGNPPTSSTYLPPIGRNPPGKRVGVGKR